MSLQEKEKQLTELREHLARQPGPEVIDEARSLKMEVQKKVKMVQSLTAERNMYMTENLQGKNKLIHSPTKRPIFEPNWHSQDLNLIYSS